VVEVVDTVLRANLPLRLAFRVGTSDESRVATGLTDVDCVRLPGSGAGYFVRDGRERRIQTHYLDPDGIFDVVDGIAAQWLADTPYRIVTQNAVVEEDDLPATVTQDQVDLILGSMEMGELFADDGTPIRGVKSRIIALVHGADAPRGGANNLWANLILGYIFRTQA
jgi:DNA segregation ATPase FtsK/SpoIIIE-like protein